MSSSESSSAIEAAADKVRSLKAAKAPQAEVKAAVEAYIALTEGKQGEAKAAGSQSEIEKAAEKVRSLKAARAPQAEVKAAVEAYIALTEGKQTETHQSAAPAQSHSLIEAAAEKVRSLKASRAPQAEVKAAVEHYISLTEGKLEGATEKVRSVAETVAEKVHSAVEVVGEKVHSVVEAAAEKVRSLKAARAPQAEVKAAVEHYIHVTTPSHAGSAKSTSTSESKSEHNAELEAAADKVRSLKAAKAPQAEVKAAVEAYIVAEAKAKVVSLKAARAPQEEVKAAVEAYNRLTQSSATSASTTEQAAEHGKTETAKSETAKSDDSAEAPSVTVHMPQTE